MSYRVYPCALAGKWNRTIWRRRAMKAALVAALREICLLPCEELADLEREIATYVKKSSARPAH